MEPVTKITKARVAMIQGQRFFGALALGLEVKERPSIETIATDGKHLFFNPKWVEQAPVPQVIGLCAKMALHLSLLHHTRRRGRDEARWKQACDIACNLIIDEAKFELPPSALIDKTMAGKSAEEIYRLLPNDQDGDEGDDQQSGGGGAGKGSGSSDDDTQGDDADASGDPGSEPGEQDQPDPSGAGQVLDAANDDGSEPSQAEMQQIEAEAQVAVCQAQNIANAAGQGTALTERLVENIKQSQQDWIEETRRFVTARAKDDYSWQRPNRRFAHSGMILPSLHSKRIGKMVLAVDVSGSVMNWLDDFCGEIKKVAEDVQPEELIIIWCADRIAGIDRFEPGDDIVIKPKGFGGTSFVPPFEWVENEGFEPACLIYLTDLDGTAPKNPPDYPVLWACTTNKQAPWGERVQLRR